jgi:ribosome recycling factor
MSFVLATVTRASRRNLALQAAPRSTLVPCLDRLLHVAASAFTDAPASASTVTTLTHTNGGAIRWKHAAKSGNHMETLNELAHEKSREEAQVKRSKKKEKKVSKKSSKGKAEDTSVSVSASQEEEEQDDDTEDDEDDEEDAELLPNPEKIKQRMRKILDSFDESLKAIRGGEPTPELFDDVMVDAYGSMAPLKSVAQVVIATATQATATCFDPAIAKAVSTAIRDKLSLNPSIEEGGVVKIPLPRVSMETRQKTAANLGKKTESFRQRVRKVRRKALDVVKQGVAGKLDGVSKDDAYRVQKEVEVLTDQVIQSLNDAAEKKHESIMSV